MKVYDKKYIYFRLSRSPKMTYHKGWHICFGKGPELGDRLLPMKLCIASTVVAK